MAALDVRMGSKQNSFCTIFYLGGAVGGCVILPLNSERQTEADLYLQLKIIKEKLTSNPTTGN